MMPKASLHTLLDFHYHHRNEFEDFKIPDPIIVARKWRDKPYFEEAALFCALFAYGNAARIVKFLESIDFELFEGSEEKISKVEFPYYRFQNKDHVYQAFLTLYRIYQNGGLKHIALKGYENGFLQDELFGELKILGAMNAIIKALYENLDSKKLRTKIIPKPLSFLFQKPVVHITGHSALKRLCLFLRWMVRKDRIDFGIWEEIHSKDLILPLDTHTFRLVRELGLIDYQSYNLKAALLATQALSQFCPDDPVRYDFALYRIGQEKLLKTFLS